MNCKKHQNASVSGGAASSLAMSGVSVGAGRGSLGVMRTLGALGALGARGAGSSAKSVCDA